MPKQGNDFSQLDADFVRVLEDLIDALIAEGDHAAEGPLPMERFRPNLVVSGTAAWDEDAWARIAVGEVTFNGLKLSDNAVDVRNTTSTFKIVRNP